MTVKNEEIGWRDDGGMWRTWVESPKEANVTLILEREGGDLKKCLPTSQYLLELQKTSTNFLGSSSTSHQLLSPVLN